MIWGIGVGRVKIIGSCQEMREGMSLNGLKGGGLPVLKGERKEGKREIERDCFWRTTILNWQAWIVKQDEEYYSFMVWKGGGGRRHEIKKNKAKRNVREFYCIHFVCDVPHVFSQAWFIEMSFFALFIAGFVTCYSFVYLVSVGKLMWLLPDVMVRRLDVMSFQMWWYGVQSDLMWWAFQMWWAWCL